MQMRPVPLSFFTRAGSVEDARLYAGIDSPLVKLRTLLGFFGNEPRSVCAVLEALVVSAIEDHEERFCDRVAFVDSECEFPAFFLRADNVRVGPEFSVIDHRPCPTPFLAAVRDFLLVSLTLRGDDVIASACNTAGECRLLSGTPPRLLLRL